MSELYARHNFVNSSTLLVHRLNFSALKCFYNNKCAAKLRLRIIKHCSCNDYCVISLSDLMTPWELIEKRLAAAAVGDFCMAIYNPSSHHRADYLKKACDILQKNGVEPERACGYVENIGRENTACKVCTLAELRERQVNMFTTVFIGNSRTKIIGGKLVTPRGYVLPDPAV